ncbi:hypothetical protein LzC2_42750 [Planctomycetes bacterium LzC2]|uniref:Uncharacterized protein n=1 Tax=Alienimonas chondri TaxID=2681879 RepID=A0ABX1VNJ6_9PLAN|nr:hypothetical protein [Alienimonas chondri]
MRSPEAYASTTEPALTSVPSSSLICRASSISTSATAAATAGSGARRLAVTSSRSGVNRRTNPRRATSHSSTAPALVVAANRRPDPAPAPPSPSPAGLSAA